MPKKLKEVPIDRARWLRGEGGRDSRLHRQEDDRECCVGFLCEAIGVPREVLTSLQLVSQVPKRNLPAAVFVELQRINNRQVPLCAAYDANDEKSLQEDEREEKVTEAFAGLGYKPVFTGP